MSDPVAQAEAAAPAPGTPGPVLVLVGPPGAGKTTVGELVAARLGVPFADTDRLVEAGAGASVADLFVQRGEPEFRVLERDAVRDALAGPAGVLALGGGAPLDPMTRDRLADVPVVFLDVSAAGAAERVGMDRSRPLLLGNVRGQLRDLLAARRPVYEAVARVTVETDQLSAEQVADAVLAALDTGPAATPAPPPVPPTTEGADSRG